MTAHPQGDALPKDSQPENIQYEEPLELVDPPEDEAVRMADDWGTQRALTVARQRLAYWQTVIARLLGETVEAHGEGRTDERLGSGRQP